MVVFLCLCCLCFGNPLWAFWQSISSRREPIHCARIYECTHEMGNGNAYSVKWICVFDNARIRARWIGPYAWRNVRNQFRGCSQRYRRPSAAFWQTVSSRREPIYRARIYVFATHSQSVGTHLAIRQQHYRNPFRMPSRNVRNVFVFCVLHIRRAKVWFLACKNPLFTLQKPPFWRARSGFLQSLN